MNLDNKITASFRRRIPWVLTVCVIVTGCSTMQQPPSDNKNTAVVSVPALSRPDGSVRVDTADERVARLWRSAEIARQQQRTSAALEILYEALDISPDNSLLWSRAAELQLDSLEAALAENFAVKSNSFAGNNQQLLYRNWLIIQHARDMRGDLLGVRSAHKKVQQYQYR